MRVPVSIVIPTLNEEKYLPRLLNSIESQTIEPFEVIVADAYSTDQTQVIAQTFGCKLVEGGKPGMGRNNGAKWARGRILLFLDADMILPARFLESALEEMVRRKLDIAPCLIAPDSSSMIDDILIDTTSLFLKMTEKLYPHGGGACLFVKKYIHDYIQGFDESILLAEDHDYVRRAAKLGKFSFLKDSKALTSLRRLDKEGRWKLFAKYTISELHQIFIGPIRKPIYTYEFGKYQDLEDYEN